MLPAQTFYMIRHGQTEANAARIMAGHLDSPLTALGRAQAEEAQKVVAALDVRPVALFHSHLSRARDTAQIMNEALQAPIFEDSDLAEINVGDLEGAPYEECADLLFNSWPIIPNGETPNAFFERVKRGKTRALSQFNEPILIVCHGGVMRAFGEIHGLPTPGKFENARLYEFQPLPEVESGELSSQFPWDVFEYALCPESRTINKSRSLIYDVSAVDKIA